VSRRFVDSVIVSHGVHPYPSVERGDLSRGIGQSVPDTACRHRAPNPFADQFTTAWDIFAQIPVVACTRVPVCIPFMQFGRRMRRKSAKRVLRLHTPFSGSLSGTQPSPPEVPGSVAVNARPSVCFLEGRGARCAGILEWVSDSVERSRLQGHLVRTSLQSRMLGDVIRESVALPKHLRHPSSAAGA